MNISDLQLVANRANAAHSTGPRTPEGKKRSSLNALRHGLSGQIVVMPNEDLQAYNEFLDRYIRGLNPKNEPEQQLAFDMANTTWKLNRSSSIENGIYALGHHDNADRTNVDDPEIHSALTAATTYLENSRQLENLSRQENRLRRALQKSIKLYEDMQDRRRAQEREDMIQALPIAKTHKMQSLPYDPASDGFVLSNAEIDRHATREQHCKEAQIASEVNYDAKKFLARRAA